VTKGDALAASARARRCAAGRPAAKPALPQVAAPSPPTWATVRKSACR
jgi:hypothetical protein